MSHFSVLVVTSNKPSQKELEDILQPWHEYECTGVKDKYVVEIDITDEVIEEFNKPIEAIFMGSAVYSRYDEKFYTEESTDGFDRMSGRKQFKLPDGAEIKTIPAEEARNYGLGYPDLAACAKDYFGCKIERDGKFYRLTNPNKKWDWWSIGGRWTGMLIPRYEPSDDPRNKEKCELCNGTGKRTDEVAHKPGNEYLLEKCNGCEGTGIRIKWPTGWQKIAGDQMMLGDIPLITLRDDAENKALKRYDKAKEIINGRQIPNWDEIRKKCPGIEKARGEFNNNEVLKDLMKAKIIDPWGVDLSEFMLTREQVASKARAKVICPFAYVHNGQWYERGEMGWWACVNDEKDQDVWAEQFDKLLNSLPSDTWLTVIDCHI